MTPPFLTSTLDGGEWSVSRSCRFTPGEGAPSTHCLIGWVGPEVHLDAIEKRNMSYPCRKSSPCTSAVL
jgi:hypothetical protein